MFFASYGCNKEVTAFEKGGPGHGDVRVCVERMTRDGIQVGIGYQLCLIGRNGCNLTVAS